MAVLTPRDVERPAIELDGSATIGQSSSMRGDERGAGAAAASESYPGAPLPDAQPDMATVADRGYADVGALWEQPIMLEGGPEHSEIDPLDVVDEKRRIFRFEKASNGLDPSVRLAGLATQEVGDAARGVAAGFGLAAIGIADAHQNPSRGMTRRFEEDHLIASDAGAAIGERAYTPCADGYRATAKIEHDKVIAEPVHLEERDLAHGAAYMAARPVLSNAEAPGA